MKNSHRCFRCGSFELWEIKIIYYSSGDYKKVIKSFCSKSCFIKYKKEYKKQLLNKEDYL